MKAIVKPSTNPDCWNAQGKDTIAEPTRAFQTLKIMTNELSPVELSVNKIYLIMNELRLTFLYKW